MGVNPECGIPRVGQTGPLSTSKSLGNIADVIVCGLSILLMLALILWTSRRKAAVGEYGHEVPTHPPLKEEFTDTVSGALAVLSLLIIISMEIYVVQPKRNPKPPPQVPDLFPGSQESGS